MSTNVEAAAGPPNNAVMNSQLEAQIDEMFDRADDLMINQKDYGSALEIYKEILQLDSENIDALNSQAQCLKSTANGNPQVINQVFSLYSRAIKIDPEDFETNFNLGVLYFEHRRDLDKAIHHLKLAISEEDNATAQFNLAIIYDEKGMSQEAMKAYQEVSSY